MRKIVDFIKANIKQFLKFGIVGFINTISSWIIYYSLIFLKVNYLIATTIAFIITSIIGYLLNRKWVFKSSNKSKKSIIRYYTVYISSYFLNLGVMYLIVDILSISELIAPILTLFVTVPYNYFFSRMWVFKQEKNMNYTHSFAIVAYKESEYLEECIKSLLNQTVKSNIYISTSTPNINIQKLAKKYNLKVYETGSPSDIQNDWNFAYSKATTDLVTLAHQDDIYHKDYLENILELANKYSNFKMIHTDYYPYKNNKISKDKNSKIKELLKLPLRIKFLSKIKFFKVLSLSFGNSVNCPSVTYNKNNIKGNPFTSKLKFGLDWDTFLKFAKEKGHYLYIPKKLVNYRIYDGATTKEFIVNNKRYKEDEIMFNKIWPKFIVKLIMKVYTKSYDTYRREK